MSEKYKDKKWLRNRYEQDNLPKRKIANLADCGRTTISRYVDRYNLKRPRKDPRVLYDLYTRRDNSNGIKWDNRSDNIEVMDPSEHIKKHHSIRGD